MLLSRTINYCKIIQLELCFSTFLTFNSKMTITGALAITGSFTLMINKCNTSVFAGNKC